MGKILVTGANGFIGRNLCEALRLGQHDVLAHDLGPGGDPLDALCAVADFVFHLAGVNRPDKESDFADGNAGSTKQLLDCLHRHRNHCPVMLSSSIQAALDNPYGRSKRAAEALLFEYHRLTGADILVYRFPNVFGKWSRPDYNSAIATFCRNIALDLPVRIDDPETQLHLAYIDDVVDELLRALDGRPMRQGSFCSVPVSYRIRLSEAVRLIESFKAGRAMLQVPDLSDAFTKKLYSTYISFLPEGGLLRTLDAKKDGRGFFAEFLRTPDRGQVAVNVVDPGARKGDHWHQSKCERFLILAGEGLVRMRTVGQREIRTCRVGCLDVLDIPPGVTHHIENTGTTELVMLIWANESFDPDRPDTYRMEV